MKLVEKISNEIKEEIKECMTFDGIVKSVARYIALNYKRRTEPLKIKKKRK